MTLKVVTANRLTDGLVVYLDAAGVWSERIENARVAQDDDFAAELLALAETPEQVVRVVGPYLMDVALEADVPYAISNREVIRSRGPTVRPDLGRQAGPAG